VQRGSSECVSLLISAGANVNSKDVRIATIFYISRKRGRENEIFFVIFSRNKMERERSVDEVENALVHFVFVSFSFSFFHSLSKSRECVFNRIGFVQIIFLTLFLILSLSFSLFLFYVFSHSYC